MFDVLTVVTMENTLFWDVIVMIALIIFEKLKPCSSSLYNFLLTPATSSLLRPNILGSTLLSNTLSPNLRARDQGFHIQDDVKAAALYILIFTFLDSTRENKASD